MRRSLLLLLSLFSACRCGDGVDRVAMEPLRISPTALRLPPVFLSRTSSGVVSITNPSRVTAHLTAEVSPPFSVPAEADLPGGDALELRVDFTPVSADVFRAVLTLRDALSRVYEVELVGEGLPWPDCGTPLPCETRHFDPEAGICVTAHLDDDTPCTSAAACFASAVCRQGQCVGTFDTCDDGDACTIDACGEQGCTHQPRACEVTDACQVARCDAARGCVQVPVDDGLPCGPETCAEAAICLGGRCEVRARPNAATDCFYSEVETGWWGRGGAACAVTRGGQVKCWGGTSRLPWLEPAWTGATSLRLSRRLCAIFPGGWVGCSAQAVPLGGPFGPPQQVPFSGVVTQLEVGRAAGEMCALLVDGRVECVDHVGTMTESFDGGVVELAPPCARRADGSVRCADGEDAGTFDTLRSFFAAGVWGFNGAQGTGLSPSWQGREVAFDAGVVALGGGVLFREPAVCAADVSGRVRCQSWTISGSRSRAWEDGLTPPVRQLTRNGFSVVVGGALCALDGHDEVWCLGMNTQSELGDLSVRPAGDVEMPLPARATAVSMLGHCCTRGIFSTASTWVAVDGGVLQFAVEASDEADGGYPLWFPTPPGLVPVAMTVTDSVRPTPETLRFLDGEGRVWTMTGPVPTPEPIVSLAGLAVASASGRVWFLSNVGVVSEEPPARQVTPRCRLWLDGGVNCFGAELPLPPMRHISTDAESYRGCGVDEQGRVWCWHSTSLPDGGTEFSSSQIAGVLPFARQVSGGGQSGCALVGTNGVQCWGSVLGQADGGVRFWPMSEPVTALTAVNASACVLTAGGAVRCRGDNLAGFLGVWPRLSSERFLKIPW